MFRYIWLILSLFNGELKPFVHFKEIAPSMTS